MKRLGMEQYSPATTRRDDEGKIVRVPAHLEAAQLVRKGHSVGVCPLQWNADARLKLAGLRKLSWNEGSTCPNTKQNGSAKESETNSV